MEMSNVKAAASWRKLGYLAKTLFGRWSGQLVVWLLVVGHVAKQVCQLPPRWRNVAEYASANQASGIRENTPVHADCASVPCAPPPPHTHKEENTIGLRDRNSPTCTLSQNGYGNGDATSAFL